MKGRNYTYMYYCTKQIQSKCFVLNYNQKYFGHIKHLDNINQHVNIIFN